MAAAVLALSLLMVGCGGGGSVLPQGEPYLDGTITDRAGGRVLVESHPGEQHGNKCWFAVEEGTRVLRAEEQEYVRVSPDALAEGQRVQVWTRGPILESYPCQAAADTIVILP